MEENPESPPRRRTLRLRRYDYSRTGAYFVTICTQNRVCLFGKVTDGTMSLTDAGKMVQTVWNEIPKFYAGVEVDEFVVMPNHIHGIVVLEGAAQCNRSVGAGPCACPDATDHKGNTPTRMSLPDVVQRLKAMTTKRYIDGVGDAGWPRFSKLLWQRSYFEHVIRNPESLDRIRRYILENPGRWTVDPENLQALAPKREDPWES